MSLIQQALEKTNRVQETKITNPPSVPKMYDRDPMGAALEQELTQVQQSYAKRRRLYRRVSLGALLVCLIAGLSYVGIRQISSGVKSAPVEFAPVPAAVLAPALVKSKMPIKIDSGNIYRLTGITNINGKPMAVINEEIVSVGDSLSGNAIIKAIGNGEVRLDVQGKEINLIL